MLHVTPVELNLSKTIHTNSKFCKFGLYHNMSLLSKGFLDNLPFSQKLLDLGLENVCPFLLK